MSQSVAEILQNLVDAGYTRETLAAELGTTPSALNRWLRGLSRPRPALEGRLKEKAAVLLSNQGKHNRASQYHLEGDCSGAFRKAVDGTLRELREIFHRRARLSSRNEALDEVSKLLFAHVTSVSSGGQGITIKALEPLAHTNDGLAVALKSYVRVVFETHLPPSLAHDLSHADFDLRIKPSEVQLAREVVDTFEKLGTQPDLLHPSGVRGIDVLNEVFGKFLADSFVDEKQLGQYLTPTEVVQFMVRLAIRSLDDHEYRILADPSRCAEFGLVLDPSCGVGSFLAEFVRAVHPKVMENSTSEQADAWLHRMVTDVIVGVDKSERMIRLALANLAMFGFPAARLQLANALARVGPDAESTEALRSRARIIITNPPFGAEFSGDDLTESQLGSRPASSNLNSEILFIERYLEWLRPGGQLLAIVPDSILTNKGTYEQLRRRIADQIDIRSIISLPAITFGASGTNTKTSILHCYKRPQTVASGSRTAFAICQDIGFTIATRGNHRRKFSTGKGQLPLILEELHSEDLDANLIRRVEGLAQSHRWDATYHASLPVEIEERLRQPGLGDLRVSDVADLVDERDDPRRWGVGAFRYIEISDVDPDTLMLGAKDVSCAEAPSRARKMVRAGDVLVSTVRPDRRGIGVVSENDAVCTTGFAVLRPHSMNSLVLAHLLKTDFVAAQILRNNVGIAYPAIDEECLPSILLPTTSSSLESLRHQSEVVLALELEARRARESLVNEVSETARAWSTGLLVGTR